MHEYDPGQPEAAIVQEALEHPIGTPALRELAKGKKKVVLVTSDHTRAVPSKLHPAAAAGRDTGRTARTPTLPF